MKKVFFYSLIFIVACLICIYFYFQPKIIFVDQEIHLALYQEVNPLQYIQKLSHIEIDDIQVDNQVDNGKLGKYQIHYSTNIPSDNGKNARGFQGIHTQIRIDSYR